MLSPTPTDEIFLKNAFKSTISLSGCQTVWIQIRADIQEICAIESNSCLNSSMYCYLNTTSMLDNFFVLLLSSADFL